MEGRLREAGVVGMAVEVPRRKRRLVASEKRMAVAREVMSGFSVSWTCGWGLWAFAQRCDRFCCVCSWLG